MDGVELDDAKLRYIDKVFQFNEIIADIKLIHATYLIMRKLSNGSPE